MREDLDARLRRMAAQTESAARLAEVDAIRARGERRRTRNAMTAGILSLAAIGLVTGGALATIGGGGADKIAGPGPTSPTPSTPSPADTDPPSPTDSPSTNAPATPSDPAPPTASKGPATGPPATPPVTRIPDDLRLPGEGEPGWERDDSLGAEWELDPCMPTAYPTDRLRTDMRTVTRTVTAEHHQVHQLAVYPNEETAREVMQGFGRVLDACQSKSTEPRSLQARTDWTTSALDVPDEGLLTRMNTVSGAEERLPFSQSISVMRRGNAVFLVHASGEIGDRRAEVAEVARGFADDMCAFAPDCR